MLEAVEEFQTCFHLLHPAFHACSSGKNVVFTLLPGKTIRNVNCTAQEVEQGLARKEFFFACKQEDSTFPTILREGVGRISRSWKMGLQWEKQHKEEMKMGNNKAKAPSRSNLCSPPAEGKRRMEAPQLLFGSSPGFSQHTRPLNIPLSPLN